VLVAASLHGELILGGYRRDSHDVRDLKGCVIASPELLRTADWLREALAYRQ